ncbi:MAG: hypothetical protein KC502_23630, partial [Myxococcales bacterium]|nr:hypothetical protein [Myxococcales bacterium]
VAVVERPGRPQLVIIKGGVRKPGTHRVQFLHWSQTERRLKPAKPLGAGRRIVIKIWSEEPQDWRGVRIKIQQFSFQPNVPEAEWRAYLAKEEAEERADRAERTKERRQERVQWRKRWSKRRAEQRKRQQRCRRLPKDEDCWGPGGLAGHKQRKRAAADKERKRRLEWRKRRAERLRKMRAERERRAAEPKPPKSAPPAMRLEDPGPLPSQRAVWVTGFWQWTGFEWVWLSGWWKVPEVDVKSQMTALAPTAPPPPQVEAVTLPPCAGAVWLTGYWVYRAQHWVWLPGRWVLRPSATVRWRTPRWIRVHGGVRLDPGRWLRAIRKK